MPDSPPKWQKRKATKPAGQDGSDRKRQKTVEAAPIGKRKASNDGHAGGRKKQWATTDSGVVDGDVPLGITPPDGCEPWALNGLALITGHELGSQWRCLIKAWLWFEALSNFNKDSKAALLATGRPASIGQWIKCYCASNYHPEISNPTSFASKFSTWWHCLQPQWRIQEGSSTLLQDINGNWSALRCPSINGILSAIAALFFWGYAIINTPNTKAEWDNMVLDMVYALEELIRLA